VLRFFYHRSIAPMMWVLIGLATIELFIVHFLLALWNMWVAALVSAATLVALIWMIRAIMTMRMLPVLVLEDRLVMRVGAIRSIEVPFEQVAGLRENWSAGDVRHRSVLNLALIAYPNIVIDLREPTAGKRPLAAVAHRLDDAAAFRTAVLERLARVQRIQSATSAAT